MRRFSVVWAEAASLHVLKARAFLGVARAAELDDEIDRIAHRLAALPESGAPTKTRRGWALDVRRVTLSGSPYVLFYRLDLEREIVTVFALRHQRSRPLAL